MWINKRRVQFFTQSKREKRKLDLIFCSDGDVQRLQVEEEESAADIRFNSIIWPPPPAACETQKRVIGWF